MAATSIRLACGGALAVALLAGDDGRVQRPVLGYFVDGNTELRSVEGIPAAARMARLDGNPAGFRWVTPVPRKQFAIGVRDTDGMVVILAFANGTVQTTTIEGLRENPESVVISPGGTTAAIAYKDRLLVATGLPASPELSAPIERPSGVDHLLAVSDDGGAILGRSVDGAFLLSAAADARVVAAVPQLTSAAFLPGSRDALLGDAGTNRIALLHDVTGAAELSWFDLSEDASLSPQAIAPSQDGKRAFVASNGRVSTIDLVKGSRSEVVCSCNPAKFERWTGGEVFLMGGDAERGLLLFQAGDGDPQIFSVPPQVDGGER